MNGAIEVHRDTIAEKLDEMADLSEHWKRNREKGRNPNAIRAAMLMLAQEVTAIARAQAEAALQSRDREDAERYRWLRRHWFTMTSSYQGDRVHFTINQPRYSNATERDVDAAIDHARRIEGEA